MRKNTSPALVGAVGDRLGREPGLDDALVAKKRLSGRRRISDLPH